MIRLTRVELRRLLSRYLVIATFLGMLAATGAALFGTWQSSQPMSAQQEAEAEQFYQQELASWEENGEEMLAQCLQDEERESEAQGVDVDFGCEQMEPQREWYVWTSPPLEDTLPGQLSAVGLVLMFGALLVGATSTAAEISTGAIGNWLTFEPRRILVYASKLVAAGLVVLPVALLLLLIAVGGTWLIADSYALAGTMTQQDWTETGWAGLRVLAIVGAAATFGATLGFLLKHTAAVLGVVIVYVVVVENMLGNLVQGLQPWLLMKNIDAWIAGGTFYYVQECTTSAGGTSCTGVEHPLEMAQAALYLGVLGVVVVLVTALVFRRRDVS